MRRLVLGGWGRAGRALLVFGVVSLVAAGAGVWFGSAAADSSLAGEWHLDEIDGSGDLLTTPDSSGNGNSLTESGGGWAALVPGRFGQAIDFSGQSASTGGLVGAEKAVLEPQQLTVVAWVKGSGSPGNDRYLVAQGGNGNGQSSGCTGSAYALYTGPSGGLEFYVAAGGMPVTASPDAGGGIWDGQWHAVAGSYDGSTVRLYVDGNQVGQGTPASGAIDYSENITAFDLGAYPACTGFEYSKQLDEVRVYNRVLSATEIQYLQTSSASTPPELPPPSETLSVNKAGSGSGSISSSPAGITCGSTCSASYPWGTTVTLAATANAGSTFAGWSGDCSGTGACTVTMDQARNVTAAFDSNTASSFTLSVGISGTGSGSVSSQPAGISCAPTCAASFNAGTTVTLTAAAASGSAFAGWSGDCSGTGACTVTMNRARNVSATFTAAGGGGGGGGGGERGLVLAKFGVVGRSHSLHHALLLDARASTTTAGAIANYRWTTSGGTAISSDHPCGSIPLVSLSFRHGGTQTLTLQVTTTTGQTSTVTNKLTVPPYAVNRALEPAYDCENPGAGNQANRKDCVKTFAWGVVQVNSRGGRDDCFQLQQRNPLRSPHAAVAAINPGAPSLGSWATHATIKGPVAIDGLYLPIDIATTSSYDDWDSTIQIGKPIPIDVATYHLASVQLNTTVGDPDRHTGLVPLVPNIGLTGDNKSLGALPLAGTVDVNLSSAKTPDGFYISKVKLHVKLPSPFPSLPVDGYLESDNETGAHITGFQVGPFDADILPGFSVKKAFFKYVGGTDQVWKGGADIYLPGQIPAGTGLSAVSPTPLPGINFSPPPPDLGIGFRHGHLDHFGIGINFIPPFRPVLFPGVTLSNAHLAFGLDPFRFTGGIGIALGELLGIDGDVFVAFASHSTPYAFPNDVATGDLSPLAGRWLDSFTIAVGGDAHIEVPVAGQIPLLNAWVIYEAPDYFELGSHFDFKVTLLELKGDANGWVVPSQGKFSLGGDLSLCVNVHVLGFDLGQPCLGNGIVVSSRGFGGCTTVLIPSPVPLVPAVPVTIAAGYTWGGGFEVKPFSCDLSDFTEANPRAAADRGSTSGRAAQAGWSFKLGRGLPSAQVRVTGNGGAPAVTLTGPGGQAYSTANPPKDPRQALIMQYGSTTVIAVNHPAAGGWTLTGNAGSVPIASVAYAHGLPDLHIKVRVTGRRRSRTLTYHLTPAPGRTVTFVERGPRTYHLLGAAHGARGRIHFTPGNGRGGRRDIVAVVEENGVQTQSLVVARYSAPGPERPARPARVRVAHRGFALDVTWAPVAGAVSYEVLVEARDGGREMAIVRGHRTSIIGIEPGLRGRVLVSAVSAEGIRGPARTGAFAAIRGTKPPRRRHH